MALQRECDTHLAKPDWKESCYCFYPDLHPSSFQRSGKRKMNIASGYPIFISIEHLLNSDFIKDYNAAFFRIVVDTSDLPKIIQCECEYTDKVSVLILYQIKEVYPDMKSKRLDSELLQYSLFCFYQPGASEAGIKIALCSCVCLCVCVFVYNYHVR